MILKRFFLATAFMLGLLGASVHQAQAAILLSGDTDNRLTFANNENLYDSSGNYLPGNTPPAIGDYLLGILEITSNQSNGWHASVNLNSTRDTYTGLFAQKITNISGAPGNITITLTTLTPGDATTFNGGGGFGAPGAHVADASSFSTIGILDYSKGDQVALYHQDGTMAGGLLPLYSSVNGTIATEVGVATEGSKFLTLTSNGAVNSFANEGANGNYYSFSKGSTPPGTFTLTNFSGLYVDVNNTGFAQFDQISDSNVAGGGLPVSFYLESRVNFNVNAKYNPTTNSFNTTASNAGRTSSWDFQSSDPADLQPTGVVPEPSSIVLFSLLGIGLAGCGFRRNRKAV
jgi:hypothetical protein